MNELRCDPLTGRWAIISEARQHRGSDFAAGERSVAAGQEGGCPFCPGNEHLAPPELDALRDKAGAWRVRSFANKYPLLRHDATCRPHAGRTVMPARGTHEVIVVGPEHERSFAEHSDAHLVAFVDFCARRVAAVRDEGCVYPLLFANHGAAAGASRRHAHVQLLGLPVVPTLLQRELAVAQAQHREHGGCHLCHLLEMELEGGERVVAASEEMVLLAAYAARVPFELLLLPRRHPAPGSPWPGGEAQHVAVALRDALARLARHAGDIAYNWFLHLAPQDDAAAYFHWHIEIIPRLSQQAGYEWGAGDFATTTSPEHAAALLRTTRQP